MDRPRGWLGAGRAAGWLSRRSRRWRTLTSVAALIAVVLGGVVATAVLRSGPGARVPTASGSDPGHAGAGQPGGATGSGTSGNGTTGSGTTAGSGTTGSGDPAGGQGGSSADRTATGPPQGRPGPVLLVPGYGGGTGGLTGLAAKIRASGRPARILDLPDGGTGDLTADARVLNAAVSRALRNGAPSVDVIGYSAGGVIALIWARNDGGAAKARRVITLGSPFHGTEVAAAANAFVPRLCPVACRELVPGSSLLAGLGAAPVPRGMHWLSLWSSDDLVVTPPASARLPGALNAEVQSVCPGRQINHLQLPTDPAVTAMVLRAISKAPLRLPSAAACRS